MMKKLLMLVTLLMFTLAFGTNGFAVPIEVDDAIQFTDGPGPYASVAAGRGGAFWAHTPSYDFVTFCLETNEDLAWSPATFYVDKISTEAKAGGAGGQDTPTGDTLSPFSAYLYHQAVSGEYGEYDDDPVQFQYVQYAIWYIEGEIDYAELPGEVTDPATPKGFYAAQNTAFGSSGWSGLGNVRVLNLVDSSGRPSQDVLVEVAYAPEPATLLVFGAGLIGLVGVGRTKWFKRG